MKTCSESIATAQLGPVVRNESFIGQQADSANHADGRNICGRFEGHVNLEARDKLTNRRARRVP
jgi:hypothetical protein